MQTREADESKVSNTLFLELHKTFDVSVTFEKLSELFISPIFGIVLYIKIVEKFSDI